MNRTKLNSMTRAVPSSSEVVTSTKAYTKKTFQKKIGSKSVMIQTDFVDTKIPLLLSKETMKTAETEIYFKDDTVKMFGQTQKVQLTQSGHYAIPLNDSSIILKNIQKKNKISKITLVYCDQVENENIMAWKLQLNLDSLQC